MDSTAGTLDDRLDAGMAAQRGLLHDAVERGARQVGWKAGLGTAAARASLGTVAPLVGFLLDATSVIPGATVSLDGWTSPRAEAEIALRVGRDVPEGTPQDEVIGFFDAIAPAIELVDLSFPPTDVSRVLAGNIYHRAWCTGAFRPLPSIDDLRASRARVSSMDQELDLVTDVEAATGPARDVVGEVGRVAARHGRGLRQGDVVILGSMVPVQTIGSGGTFAVMLDDHEPVSVRFA